MGCKYKFTHTFYISPCDNPENQDTEPSDFFNKNNGHGLIILKGIDSTGIKSTVFGAIYW